MEERPWDGSCFASIQMMYEYLLANKLEYIEWILNQSRQAKGQSLETNTLMPSQNANALDNPMQILVHINFSPLKHKALNHKDAFAMHLSYEI
jgi:hypothetical protein